MAPHTVNNFDPWHVFAREGFDGVGLFNFRKLGTFPDRETFSRLTFLAMILDAIHFHTAK
jgi:hypothetical protein